MVAAQRAFVVEAPEDLTNATGSDIADRAVEIVLGLADGRGLRRYPTLRGWLLMHLCTDAGRAMAARAVVERYGYVSRYPAAFVAYQLSIPEDGASWSGPRYGC